MIGKSLDEAKRWTRGEVHARIAALSPFEIAEQSKRACERLATLKAYRQAKVILFFAPTQGEVDCRPAAREALAAGKAVALPAIDWEGGTLHPTRVVSVDEGLIVRKHGIPEPPPAPQAWAPLKIGEIDAVIVPGIAFDEAGRRLGRGGGFYDRFLSQIPARTRRIGLALEVQGLREVPVGPLDARVDAVVLPSRVWRCPARDGDGHAG